MSTTKKEFPANDAEPIVLYGLQSATDVDAIPLRVDTAGNLVITVV